MTKMDCFACKWLAHFIGFLLGSLPWDDVR